MIDIQRNIRNQDMLNLFDGQGMTEKQRLWNELAKIVYCDQSDITVHLPAPNSEWLRAKLNMEVAHA